MARHAEAVEQDARLLHEAILIRPPVPLAEERTTERVAAIAGCGGEQILEHGQLREFGRELEGAHQTAPGATVCGPPGHVVAVEDDRPGADRQRPRKHGEKCRLAGAVRADEPGDASREDVDRDILDGTHPLEVTADVL